MGLLGGQIPQIATDWLAPCCCCCWHLRVLSAVSGSGLHQPPTTTSHNPVSGPVWRSHSPQTRQGSPPIRALEPRNWPMREGTTKDLVYPESSHSANNIVPHQSMARLNLENIYHYFKWLFIFTMKIEDCLCLTIKFLPHQFPLPVLPLKLN